MCVRQSVLMIFESSAKHSVIVCLCEVITFHSRKSSAAGSGYELKWTAYMRIRWGWRATTALTFSSAG